MTTIDKPRLDEAVVEQFVHQAVGDLAASISGLMLHLGDRLGLYRAMAGAGPVTASTLAELTGTHERYVREWLANQAAGGPRRAVAVSGVNGVTSMVVTFLATRRRQIPAPPGGSLHRNCRTGSRCRSRKGDTFGDGP